MEKIFINGWEKSIKHYIIKEKNISNTRRIAAAQYDDCNSVDFIPAYSAKKTIDLCLKVLKDNEEYFFNSNSKEMMRAKLLLPVKEEMNQLAERFQCSLERCGCALILYMERENQDYFLFHLGNGIVLDKNEDQLTILSHPYKGASQMRTTTEGSMMQNQLFRGNRKNHQFLLFSDLETTYYHTCGLTEELKNILMRENVKKIKSGLKKLRFEDNLGGVII